MCRLFDSPPPYNNTVTNDNNDATPATITTNGINEDDNCNGNSNSNN